MRKIPFLLIYSRILIALLVVLLVVLKPANHASIIAVIIIIGLLTDIFDGIIARKLNVSSEKLRIWDSNVDQFFWLAIIASIFYLRFSAIKPLFVTIGILVFLELLAYLISYIKFKRTVATHSLLAKFWTLTLLTFLVELLLYNTSKTYLFCFWVGLVSRLEIIFIILKLNKWATDIPSIFVVNKINKGIPVKKSKLFNS